MLRLVRRLEMQKGLTLHPRVGVENQKDISAAEDPFKEQGNSALHLAP